MSTVFVIDDDQKIRKHYKERFRDEGIHILEASNALKVVEILMREKSNIDLILLDFQMPEIDGRDIYDLIKDYTSNIPVIVTSVLPINEQKIRIPRARDYFNKAEGIRVLLSKIRMILGVPSV